jgi:ketosteroid isomerase-like protein
VEQTILIHGDVAMVTGEQRILALRDPPEPNATVRTRIICVWAHEERDWQVVRYQATFIR